MGTATCTGREQPQIFINGMNKSFETTMAVGKALAEVVDTLCEMTNYYPDAKVLSIGFDDAFERAHENPNTEQECACTIVMDIPNGGGQ